MVIARVLKVEVTRSIALTRSGARLIGIALIFTAIAKEAHLIAVTSNRSVFVDKRSAGRNEAIQQAVTINGVAITLITDTIPRDIDVVRIFIVDDSNQIGWNSRARLIAAAVVARIENTFSQIVGSTGIGVNHVVLRILHAEAHVEGSATRRS